MVPSFLNYRNLGVGETFSKMAVENLDIGALRSRPLKGPPHPVHAKQADSVFFCLIKYPPTDLHQHGGHKESPVCFVAFIKRSRGVAA